MKQLLKMWNIVETSGKMSMALFNGMLITSNCRFYFVFLELYVNI